MDDQSAAHHALLQYRQMDVDGIMVLTSRQAIHEVSDELTALRETLKEIVMYTRDDATARVASKALRGQKEADD